MSKFKLTRQGKNKIIYTCMHYATDEFIDTCDFKSIFDAVEATDLETKIFCIDSKVFRDGLSEEGLMIFDEQSDYEVTYESDGS